MTLTTKDLFELAEIASDAEDRFLVNDHDEYDLVSWEGITPHEQGAKAEGIAAVIEELERRGWVLAEEGAATIRIHTPATGWRELSNDTAAKHPRTWDRIEDIPPFVVVTDRMGDFWKVDDDGDVFMTMRYRPNDWRLIPDGPDDTVSLNLWGPFTEFVEG
jgi:hypothetical protein